MPLTNECPKCHQMYGSHIKICVPCGINLETGEPMGPVEELEPEVEVEPTAAQRYRVLAYQFVCAYFPGVMRPWLLVLSLCVAAVGVGAIYVGLKVFVEYTEIVSGSAALGFGVVIYAQALSWLFMGEMGLLIDGMVEFDAIHWNMFLFGILAPVGIVFVIGSRNAPT
ncbi:MAG: hypothetical protein ACYTGQ_19700 [Planctomycetota bacterium]|jgi:hypothetical protein